MSKISIQDVLGIAGVLAVVFLPCTGASAEQIDASVLAVSAGHVLQIGPQANPQLVVLYGVKCPDTLTDHGKAAKAFTAERVLNQKVQIEATARKWDLVFVQVQLADGSDLGELLLREGLAQWDDVVAAGDQRLKELESEAKEKGVGLWSKPQVAYAPPEPRPVELRDVRRSIQNDEAQMETYVDEDGVIRLVARSNHEKGDHNFEETVVRQRMAEAARREAERRRQEEAYWREVERQEELAAQQEYEAYERDLAIERQAIENDMMDFYMYLSPYFRR